MSSIKITHIYGCIQAPGRSAWTVSVTASSAADTNPGKITKLTSSQPRRSSDQLEARWFGTLSPVEMMIAFRWLCSVGFGGRNFRPAVGRPLQRAEVEHRCSLFLSVVVMIAEP